MATRVERVVLELDDNLTTGMAKAAAATALLKRELSGVDGESINASRSTRELGDNIDHTNRSASHGTAELNSYAGRLKLIADLIVGLGPALIPIGAVGIPAVAGLASALAATVVGAGTAILAFHNVGATLTALNKASLNPTATNLRNAQLALSELPPAARKFAQELHDLEPTMFRLRQAAAAGLFPGLEKSLTELHTRTKDVEQILFSVGNELGHLSKEAAHALTGKEWDDFFRFIVDEVPGALEGLGHIIGSVTHGLAELWMAFTPLNHDFTDVIERAAAGFDRWATGLAKTQGFNDFIEYLRTNGPLVADALLAIGNAVLKIVEAGAPLGGPLLRALTGVADAIATIADSDAGPAILATASALAILSRAQATFGKVSASSYGQAIRGVQGIEEATQRAARADGASAALQARAAKQRVAAQEAQSKAIRKTAIRGGLAAAGLALAASGAADKLGIANTATLALTGSIAGPWGAAAGAGVGLLLDLANNAHKYDVNSQELTATLDQQTGALTHNTAAYVAQKLEQDGILQRGQEFGLSVRTLTGYVLGNAGAIDKVNAALDQYGQKQRVIVGAGGNVASTIGGQAAGVSSFGSALEAVRNSVDGNVHSFQRQRQAVKGLGQAFYVAKTSAQQFRDEINRVTDVLAKRSSLRAYHTALLDFRDAVKQNGITLDQNTKKGIANQAALDGIASSAIEMAQTLKGAEQRHFLVQAKKDFIAAAEQLDLTDQQAKNLADNLFKLNKVVSKPKIYVEGIPKSLAQLEAVAAHIRALHNKTVLLSVRHTGGRVVDNGIADGGTVVGPRAPYGDRVLTMLAPGEEVISNRHGQADTHRALLQAINARRYADGGSVAASRVDVAVASTAGPGIDYGRMASAVAQVRPAPSLYGDVHVTDGYGGFRREMERDRAMASLSGVRRV